MDKNEDRWDFTLYNEALALQTLGFKKKCFAKIDQTDFLHVKGQKSGPRGAMMYDIIDCPLYSQAFRWFRKEHGLHGDITREKDSTNLFTFFITSPNDVYPIAICFKEFETYEEAELKCLQKLIEIITNNK